MTGQEGYTLPIAFRLNDRVRIVPLECPGRVLDICVDDLGTRYGVRYFNKGEPTRALFYADELARSDQ